MEQKSSTNPFDSLNEDRPQAPVVRRADLSEAQARAIRSHNREQFLREAGYTIVDDGPTKTCRVNRAWIAQGGAQTNTEGGDNARWLLFIDDSKPIPASEVLFLDETQTEVEVVMVTKQVQHGCTTMTENQSVRSAYMISTGRVAYRAA
jgi:hypothetical protein